MEKTMENLRKLFLVVSVVLGVGGSVQAQGLAPMPTFSDPELEKERQKLLLERMKLENEKLKFEVEKAKTPTSSSPVTVMLEGREEGKEERIKAFQSAISSKAGTLAESVKEQKDVLVFDFVNAELWHHGVRYQLHIFEALGRDLERPIKPKLAGRLADGYPRNRYVMGNVSLLRYQGRDRGVFEWVPPKTSDDFKFLTPEGVDGESSSGTIRNVYQSEYFSFEWQREEGEKTRVRYKHSRGLNFDDKLEFLMDRGGKILKVRYGVLDEK
jgi:hypothetical protein